MQYRNSTYASDTWDTYLYEKNLQGDVVAVYNTSGTKLVSYRYDAWGRILGTSYHNGGANTTATHNPMRYRGYYYDDDLDLYYLATRYYDPEVRRFVTADDPGYLGANGDLVSYNLFAYCSNNPIMYVDPTGHSIVAILVMLAVGFVAGGVVGGILSHNEGNEGWDLAKDVVLGSFMGLAAAGAIVSTAGVTVGAISVFAGSSITFFGTSALQTFAIGALAVDTTAFVIAPLYGFEMEGIEYESPSTPMSYVQNQAKPIYKNNPFK